MISYIYQDQINKNKLKKTHQNLLCGTSVSYSTHGFLLFLKLSILTTLL